MTLTQEDIIFQRQSYIQWITTQLKKLFDQIYELKKKLLVLQISIEQKKIELANDFHNPYNLDFKTKNLVSESRYSWNIPFASQCTFFRSTIHFQF